MKYRISYYRYNEHPTERRWTEPIEAESAFNAAMKWHADLREAAGRWYDYRQKPIIWEIATV